MTASGETQAFYRNFSVTVRVGIEATRPIHWFERLLAELGHELWVIAVFSTITVIHRIYYTWQLTRAGRVLPGIKLSL